MDRRRNKILMENYGNFSLDELAKYFNRNKKSVMQKHFLEKKNEVWKKVKNEGYKNIGGKFSKMWTSEEDEFILSNMSTMDKTELSKHLNRSPSAIRHRLIRLNVQQPTVTSPLQQIEEVKQVETISKDYFEKVIDLLCLDIDWDQFDLLFNIKKEKETLRLVEERYSAIQNIVKEKMNFLTNPVVEPILNVNEALIDEIAKRIQEKQPEKSWWAKLFS